ncbi:hypothetical protein ACIPUA_22115 [Providencia sp. AGC89]
MRTELPQTPSTSSLECFFETAVNQADKKGKISHSDIKKLLKNIYNSSEKLTVNNYYNIQESVSRLNKTLTLQHSNVIENKSLCIHKAYTMAFNKLSDASIHELRRNAPQRANTLNIIELMTKNKTIKQKRVIELKENTQNIKAKVDIFINDLYKEPYWRPNDKEYSGLMANLSKLKSDIEKSRNNILSSSYQHNPNKFKALTQLKSQLTQLTEKLQNDYDKLIRGSTSNNQRILSDNEMPSIYKLELAHLKRAIPIIESELAQLQNELQSKRSELSKQ